MEDISKIQLKDALGNAVSYNIKDATAREHLLYIFDTVEDMKNSPNLINNTFVATLGFKTKGTGEGIYYITNIQQTADNIRIFALQNSLYAILQDNGNILSYGADNTGNTDATQIFNTAIANNNKLNLKGGTYLISSSLQLPDNFELNGENAILKTSSENVEMLTANTKINITIKNITIKNSFRGITFYSCNYLKLDNITFTTTNWATLFRLCKHVKASNLYFNQVVPENYNNTDGIHINGLIDGEFKNIYGFTGDDMIALNADESNANYGEIIDVTFINCRTDLNEDYGINTINNAYRCVRFLAIANKIENIIFKNCNFANYREEVIIATGNSNNQLINNILFENCKLTNNINGKFLFNSSSVIGLIKFLNCYIINNSTTSIFNIGSKINNLIFDKINLVNNPSTSLYFLNIASVCGTITVSNFYCNTANALNFAIARAVVDKLILNNINYVSSTNYIIQTNTNADYIKTCIFNNIPKCTNNAILYNNGAVQSLILASNVDTSYLTVANGTVARQIGGVSDKTPTAPANGDTYILKSGNAYSQKIYSNGSWQ